MQKIRLFLGLGNPGSQYAATRHNAGAWCVQACAEKYGLSFKKEPSLHAYLAKMPADFPDCRLALSTDFMNQHGYTASALMHYFQYRPEEVALIHDELDLPLGHVRLKVGGGHGGHNGLRDIFQSCGSTDFLRIRVGIGRPASPQQDISAYVLHPPSAEERRCIDQGLLRLLDYWPELVKGQIATIMNHLHSE